MSRFGLGFIGGLVDSGDATVSVTGSAVVGGTLTATFNNDDPDGAATGITYQWYKDTSTIIVGATSSTFSPTDSEVNSPLRVQVSYTDAEGWPEVIYSANTASVGVVLTGTYRTTSKDITDAATYTFNSVAIGTADPLRWVVVTVHGEDTVAMFTSNVTFNGTAGIRLAGRITGQGMFTSDVAIWAGFVPTGTTVNIVVTHSTTSNECRIGVWTVSGTTDLQCAEAFTIFGGALGNQANGTVRQPACETVTNGFAIGAVSANAGTNDWTLSLTERYDAVGASGTQSDAGCDTTTNGSSANFENIFSGGASGNTFGAFVTLAGPKSGLWALHTAYLGSNSTASSFTFNTTPAGHAHSTRHIVVFVHTASNTTITGVTCNGNAMTPLATIGGGSVTANGAFIIKETSGTTCDIVVSLGTGVPTIDLGVYAVYGGNAITLTDSGIANNADPLTDTISTVAGGVFIAYGGTTSTSATFAWSGVNNSFRDGTLAAVPTRTRGSGHQRTTGASVTPSLDITAAANGNMMIAIALEAA